jgi:hypothetical protein
MLVRILSNNHASIQVNMIFWNLDNSGLVDNLFWILVFCQEACT